MAVSEAVRWCPFTWAALFGFDPSPFTSPWELAHSGLVRELREDVREAGPLCVPAEVVETASESFLKFNLLRSIWDKSSDPEAPFLLLSLVLSGARFSGET